MSYVPFSADPKLGQITAPRAWWGPLTGGPVDVLDRCIVGGLRNTFKLGGSISSRIIPGDMQWCAQHCRRCDQDGEKL
jgi:hypothetical protein